MRSFIRNIESLLENVLSVLMIGMTLIVFVNVLTRYFLNTSIPWTEEGSRFLLIFVVFIGAVLAYIENGHLGLDVLVKSLPRKAGKIVVLLSHVLSLIAMSLLTYGGIFLTSNTLKSGWTAPASGIHYGLIYLIVPITGVCLTILAISKIIISALDLIKSKEEITTC